MMSWTRHEAKARGKGVEAKESTREEETIEAKPSTAKEKVHMGDEERGGHEVAGRTRKTTQAWRSSRRGRTKRRTRTKKERSNMSREARGLDCVNVCTLLRRHFLISKRLRCPRTQIVVLWLKVERALRNKITCYTTWLRLGSTGRMR